MFSAAGLSGRAAEMPAVSREAGGRWREEGGGSGRHDGTARVSSYYCSQEILTAIQSSASRGSLQESTAGIPTAARPPARLIPRRGRSSHPSQFPKHMCAEQEINQRSSSASQNNLGVNLLPSFPPPPPPFFSFYFFYLFFLNKQDLYHVRH